MEDVALQASFALDRVSRLYPKLNPGQSRYERSVVLNRNTRSHGHKLLEIFLEVAHFQESCQFKFQPRPYSLNDKLLDKFWTKMNVFPKSFLQAQFFQLTFEDQPACFLKVS